MNQFFNKNFQTRLKKTNFHLKKKFLILLQNTNFPNDETSYTYLKKLIFNSKKKSLILSPQKSNFPNEKISDTCPKNTNLPNEKIFL